MSRSKKNSLGVSAVLSAYSRRYVPPNDPETDAALMLVQVLACKSSADAGFSYPGRGTLLDVLNWRSLDRVDAAIALLESRGVICPVTKMSVLGVEREGWQTINLSESKKASPKTESAPDLVAPKPSPKSSLWGIPKDDKEISRKAASEAACPEPDCTSPALFEPILQRILQVRAKYHPDVPIEGLRDEVLAWASVTPYEHLHPEGFFGGRAKIQRSQEC